MKQRHVVETVHMQQQLKKYVALMAVSLSQAGGRDENILTKKGYYND